MKKIMPVAVLSAIATIWEKERVMNSKTGIFYSVEETDELKADLQRHKDALGRIGRLAYHANMSLQKKGYALGHMFDSDGYIWPIETGEDE